MREFRQIATAPGRVAGEGERKKARIAGSFAALEVLPIWATNDCCERLANCSVSLSKRSRPTASTEALTPR